MSCMLKHKNSILVGQNVRAVVNCTLCSKPRCIYAKKNLAVRESRMLRRSIEKQQFICGALITADGMYVILNRPVL